MLVVQGAVKQAVKKKPGLVKRAAESGCPPPGPSAILLSADSAGSASSCSRSTSPLDGGASAVASPASGPASGGLSSERLLGRHVTIRDHTAALLVQCVWRGRQARRE